MRTLHRDERFNIRAGSASHGCDGEFYMNGYSACKCNPAEAYRCLCPNGHIDRNGHAPHCGSANVQSVCACSFTSE